MLRKPDFRFVQKNDLGEDAPMWIQTILDPFNQMIQFLISAFNGNISVQNLSVQTIKLPVTAPFVETRVAKEKTDSVYNVQIAQILDTNGQPLTVQSGLSWYENGNSVVITNIFGLTASVAYNVTIMVQYQ